MKTSLYEKYYKFGLEHFVNRKFLKLHKPTLATDVFYLFVITVMVGIGYFFF